MTKLTEVRRALAAALDHLGYTVKTATGDSAYEDPIQAFVVRIVIGEPSDENEDALDALLEPEGPQSVKATLEADPALEGFGVYVAKHSGHQLYPVTDSRSLLGAQWTVHTIL